MLQSLFFFFLLIFVSQLDLLVFAIFCSGFTTAAVEYGISMQDEKLLFRKYFYAMFVLQVFKKMGTGQQFSLRWNNYLRHITCAFDSLRSDEDLVDVTLSCEGKRIRAHKMLLSACSTYFRDLFKVSEK
jgi:hypothetical protein